MNAAQGVSGPRVTLAPEVASGVTAGIEAVLRRLVQVPVPSSHTPALLPSGTGLPLAASPATPGLLASITTTSGQATVPVEGPAVTVAQGFVRNFQAGNPAAMARILSDANVGLFGLVGMYNEAVWKLGGPNNADTRAAMLGFVKEVAFQMQAAGKCSKFEYLAFTRAAQGGQSGISFAYTPPPLPSTRPTLAPVKPLSVDGKPLKGLPQSLPKSNHDGVNLDRAREAVNAGALFDDLYSLHRRLGIGAVASLSASKQAVPESLNAVVTVDPKAVKLTGWQKAGYRFLKFWVYAFGWLGFAFSGGKYHPLDAFEKWKARNVANLDSTAKAITFNLSAVQAKPALSKDRGVDFGNELLNLLAYSPRSVVLDHLKAALKAVIPEGTDEFKEVLAGRMAVSAYDQLAKEAWPKIKSALAEAGRLIVQSDSAAVLGRMETDLTGQSVQGKSLWDLQTKQSDLDRLQSHYLTLLPDDAPGAAPEDSKTALQRRATALKEKITEELTRRTNVAEAFAGQLMELESGPLADATIKAVSGEDLAGYKPKLSGLVEQIKQQQLPEELCVVLLGSVDALTTKIGAELQRREQVSAGLGGELQKLESGDFAAITGSALGKCQTTLRGLQDRITVQLPEELRGALLDRVGSLNAKVKAELMRREDATGGFAQKLGALEAGDFTAIAKTELRERLETLASLPDRITEQLPEELRGALLGRVEVLNAKVEAELMRREGVSGGFAQKLGALEAGDLAAARLNIADNATLGRHQATLSSLRASINSELPQELRANLLKRVEELEKKIAAEPARREKVLLAMLSELTSLETNPTLVIPGIQMTDTPALEDILKNTLNGKLKERIQNELPADLGRSLEQTRARIVENIEKELERRKGVLAAFEAKISPLKGAVDQLARNHVEFSLAEVATQCETPLANLERDIRRETLPAADRSPLMTRVTEMVKTVRGIKQKMQQEERESRSRF